MKYHISLYKIKQEVTKHGRTNIKAIRSKKYGWFK